MSAPVSSVPSSDENLTSATHHGSDSLSYEYVRRIGRQANKFELNVRSVGIRYAIQQHREISRLHTFHPGERTELDYTKYLVWAYPNKNWDEPRLFYTGIGVDHTSASGVIKGYTITMQPSAATGIRLYRNCVLPKRLWLPPHLQKYADDWDVAGLDRLVAIDNAMDLQSKSMALMFIAFGTVILCMPPRRGDAKGTVERTQETVETRHISMLPGYVKNAYRFTDPRMKRVIEKAKKSAKLTIAEYEEQLLLAILDFNQSKHPTLKRPRISVYRNGLNAAPLVLPTGMRQIRSTFALSYSGKKVTREGVRVDNFYYNSTDLNELYRTSNATVDVKLDPDDVRSALIYSKQLKEPIEAALSTYAFSEPTSLELAREVLRDNGDDASIRENPDEAPDERFLARLHEIQRSTGPRNRADKRPTANADAQAAMHAAALPPVPPPASKSITDTDFEVMFGGYEE